jgi:hypothetical protein
MGRNALLTGSLKRHTSVTERFQEAAAAEDLIAEPDTIRAGRVAEQAELPSSCSGLGRQDQDSDRSGDEGAAEGDRSHGETAADMQEGLTSEAAVADASVSRVQEADNHSEEPEAVSLNKAETTAAAAAAATESRERACATTAAEDGAGIADVAMPSAGETSGTNEHNSGGFVKAVVEEVGACDAV